MRIISIKRQFESDHSSSTYRFYTRKKLSEEKKKEIEKLTGRKGGGKLEIKYSGEREISSDLELKILRYYDVEISESYDWWTSQISIDYEDKLFNVLKRWEGRGEEDLGVDVEKCDEKIIISFYYVLDYSTAHHETGEDIFDGLYKIFDDIRDEILQGDFSGLKVIGKFYGAKINADFNEIRELSASSKKLRKILGHVGF